LNGTILLKSSPSNSPLVSKPIFKSPDSASNLNSQKKTLPENSALKQCPDIESHPVFEGRSIFAVILDRFRHDFRDQPFALMSIRSLTSLDIFPRVVFKVSAGCCLPRVDFLKGNC
jgi:hypothetical protein